MKIIEWNINGRSNTNYEVPKFVSQTIIKDVDIVILTEFSSVDDGLIESLKESNYTIFYNKIRKEKNKILIGVKNEIISHSNSIKVNETMNNPHGDEEPNFLEIEVEINNKKITIVGSRIRDGKELFKKEQFNTLKNHLENIKGATVCAGDFNVWSSYIMRTWRLKPDNYQFYTPWYSGGFKNPDTWSHVGKSLYKSLIDHFITRDIELYNVGYIWDFVNVENGYGSLQPEDYKSDLKGYPDHAILQANLKL